MRTLRRAISTTLLGSAAAVMALGVIWYLARLDAPSPAGTALRMIAGAGMLGMIPPTLWVLLRGTPLRHPEQFGGLMLALMVPFIAVTVVSDGGKTSEPAATYALLFAVAAAIAVFRLTRPHDPR